MHSAGIKRPFSVSAYEEIQEDSPEYLLPVKDPYSSDDEKLKSCRMVKTKYEESNSLPVALKNYNNNVGTALTKVNNASEFKGEQSYFYQSVQFKKIDGEVFLEDKSICECLTYLFKFSSSKFFNEKECTWKGEKIVNLLNHEMEKMEFNWFVKNDNVNWKTAYSERKSEICKLHVEMSRKDDLFMSFSERLLNVALKTKDLYDEVCSENVVETLEESCLRHSIVKSCLESIASFITPIHYLQNEMCGRDFKFHIPHDVVSEKSPLIPGGREVIIQSRPDGIFTSPYTTIKQTQCQDIWLIPLQVYCPNSEKEFEHKILPPDEEDSKLGLFPVNHQMFKAKNEDPIEKQQIANKEGKDNMLESPCATTSAILSSRNQRNTDNTSLRDFLPPNTTIDALLNSIYVEDTRKYISQALPVHCRGSHFQDKMAGQHVQHLLAVARQITSKQESFLEQGVLEILGLFVVNEYVYFSRLDIEKKVTFYYTGLPYNDHANHAADALSEIRKKTKAFRELNMPSVSFSNFRLDLTVAKHRLALMIFIRNYIRVFFDKKL